MNYRCPVLFGLWMTASLSMGVGAFARGGDGTAAAATVPQPPTAPKHPTAPKPSAAPRPVVGATAAPASARLSPGNRALPDCQSYLASPLEGGMIQRDKKLYYVSAKLPDDQANGTAYLVETDLEAEKSKRLAGFRGGKSAALLEHGRSLEAISILDFSGGRPDCGEGRTAATAIKWTDQKVLPSFASGSYGYIEGDKVGHLANLETGLIQDIDLLSRQKRTLDSFAAGSRPLYVKASPPIALYTYNPKARELSKFVNNKKVADATLRLKEGMRLLQEGDKFGIMQIKNGDKTLQISQIKDWSGHDFRGFDINLPSGIAASSLAARINFANSQVLLFGKDEAARKSLGQVLFYTGKELTKTYKAPEGSYFSSVRFGHEHGIIMLLSDASSNAVTELWWVAAGDEVKKIDVIKEKKAAAAADSKAP